MSNDILCQLVFNIPDPNIGIREQYKYPAVFPSPLCGTDKLPGC